MSGCHRSVREHKQKTAGCQQLVESAFVASRGALAIASPMLSINTLNINLSQNRVR